LAGKKEKKSAKPYVVRFKYSVEEEASIYIGAENEEAAREAALEMLANDPVGRVSNPEIIEVSEYQRQAPSAPFSETPLQ
jgi:hypothetical protein